MRAPNRFASPSRGLVGALHNAVARASWLRALRRLALRGLPFPVLASDVRDVVYANWRVPIAAVRDLIPPGVEIVAQDGFTVLTVLTYRHGHFGPALAGRLRRVFPSPLQSNWRLYVRAIDGQPVEGTVLFVRNIFDSALYALGTRLFSDALPSHLAGRFDHRCDGASYATAITGGGSAPTLHCTATRSDERVLPEDFAGMFADWPAATAALCLQDAAICAVDDRPGTLALATIDLPIDLATVAPLACTAFEPGAWLRAVGAVDPPFCFVVPAAPFRVTSERLLARR